MAARLAQLSSWATSVARSSWTFSATCCRESVVGLVQAAPTALRPRLPPPREFEHQHAKQLTDATA